MNNKVLGFGLLALVIIAGLYFITKSPKTVTENTGTNQENTTNTTEVGGKKVTGSKTNTGTTTNNPTEVGSGRVVFSVTDAAANMDNINEITMEINKVETHSSVDGWVVVSTEPRTYDLLTLNDTNESRLLADINTKSGTYDQIRLGIKSISVKTKNVAAKKEAKLPSNELKINTKLVVNNTMTSSVNFDFLADKSLHVTGAGEYIFAPVVKTESKSNVTINVNTFNVVTWIGGILDDINTVGMDIDGTVKLNFQISAAGKLNINSYTGAIEIK